MRFRHLLGQFVVSVFSLWVAMWLLGVEFDGFESIVLALLLISILQFIVQPLLSLIVKFLGVGGFILVTLFSSGAIVWLGLALIPGITLPSVWTGFIVGWVYALVFALAEWITVAQSDEVFLREVTKRYRGKLVQHTNQEKGFVFVQLDGVSSQVLDWQLKAGNLPNIQRLLDEEDYSFSSWKVQLPATTPASQAGILLGSNKNIPAFRWYEKQTGKLVVANDFEGAATIEARLSTGNGLLANDGVSIGNLFSGDAAQNILVMSKIKQNSGSAGAMRDYTHFFSTPYGFMRSIILSIGEMVKELYQARQQEARNVSPRINRHGSYVLLRAATNVLMRNLQTVVVIENMIKGVPSLYVNYVDYDEIAHHAGIARPEALASLGGLDQIIGILYKARAYAGRPYEIIILSDHGQSQGPTFKQLHNGKTLEDFVLAYTDSALTAQAATAPVEDNTASRNLFAHVAQSKGVRGNSAKHISDSLERHNDQKTKSSDLAKNDFVVTGSGNVGCVWINALQGRATHKEINILYPELLPKLLTTKGIGIALVKSGKDSYSCISKDGTLELKSGKVTGKNPLHIYADVDQKDLLRLAAMDTAPDILIISDYDASRGEIYCFEELVGGHGGVGGWQTSAILLHPNRLTIPKRYLEDGKIHGAETLHKVLKHWLASS